MKIEKKPRWLPLEPQGLGSKSQRVFVAFAKQLATTDDPLNVRVRPLPAPDRATAAKLHAAQLALRDLVRQGWRVRVRRSVAAVMRPLQVAADADREKQRVRAQLGVERDEQLRHPATRAFIRSMEVRRVHAGRSVSVFSLMRDGEDLASRLEEAGRVGPGEVRDRGLRTVVAPYLQFVSEAAVDEWTGYKLLDIWRYFRHTWSSPYRSTPGRTMMVLVRDAAVEPHPVIGIAALGSAAVQIKVRDRWIGWFADDVIEHMIATPTDDAARWLQGVVKSALAEVFVDDFIEDGVVARADLRSPRDEAITRLDREAVTKRALHQKYASSSEYRETDNDDAANDAAWAKRARKHLFRSKRAELLSLLLRAQRALRTTPKSPLTGKALSGLLETLAGRKIVKSIIKRAKAERVGTALAEITVCGAVAPYNAVLGGKLVSMLLASPEVLAAYRERYRKTRSVIASSMAGRAIVRPAELVLLCTTSLYGVGSSQYNRLRMPCELAGGRQGEHIEYREIGDTSGYGTIQFGTEAIDAIATMLAQKAEGQKVKSIFGEGVSPRMRKVREGLDLLGFPSDALLIHGSPRVVYGVQLARNFREFLLGREPRADYLLPESSPADTTRHIVDWWRRRWLSARIERPEVIGDVRRHRLVHPIRHGARVTVPKDDSPQLDLALDD